MRYNVNGSADMTDPPLVRACASPLISMVRDSSATVASGASRIPFKRSVGYSIKTEFGSHGIRQVHAEPFGEAQEHNLPVGGAASTCANLI